MASISTMDEYSRKAAESFIQSVVFVDDKIYAPEKKADTSEKQVTPPKKRKPATKSGQVSEKRSTPKIYNEELAGYSPHDIQASFAKKSIVCSLHQPQKRHAVSIESATFKLCSAADIVIVDWDLYGDDGVKATELIENLVTESLKEDPHQIRLVLVYTDSFNLFDISDRVSEKLSNSMSMPDEIDFKDSDKGLAFHTLNARVVILGKPASRSDEFTDFEVSEVDLADRAICEFCKLAGGMLQGSILTGLASIRKQSRRILSKFHSGLDGPFLTHRALGIPHEEAFEHIGPLLVDEIEAVLEDCLQKPLVNDSVLQNWCEDYWQPTEEAKTFVSNELDTTDFAINFCTKGMGIKDIYDSGNKAGIEKTIKNLKKNPPKWPSPSSSNFNLLTSYLSNETAGEDQKELSILMSQRTCYGHDRILKLGTIIRETENEERYLLCLQPSCDSVRLSKPSTFIFCILRKASGDKLTHVVRADKNNIELVYKPKIENAVTKVFRPTKGVVLASDLLFKEHGDQKKTFTWIAQLKPKHAQRAAEQFARELSRVGLLESEWLRLRAKI